MFLAAVGSGLRAADLYTESIPRCCRVPINPDPAIFAAQRTLLEAWKIVTDSYEDSTFNNRDWVGNHPDCKEELRCCKHVPRVRPVYTKTPDV